MKCNNCKRDIDRARESYYEIYAMSGYKILGSKMLCNGCFDNGTKN